ncbi:hypothetical protein GCM10027276_04310 [Comamonas piscis]
MENNERMDAAPGSAGTDTTQSKNIESFESTKQMLLKTLQSIKQGEFPKNRKNAVMTSVSLVVSAARLEAAAMQQNLTTDFFKR